MHAINKVKMEKVILTGYLLPRAVCCVFLGEAGADGPTEGIGERRQNSQTKDCCHNSSNLYIYSFWFLYFTVGMAVVQYGPTSGAEEDGGKGAAERHGASL